MNTWEPKPGTAALNACPHCRAPLAADCARASWEKLGGPGMTIVAVCTGCAHLVATYRSDVHGVLWVIKPDRTLIEMYSATARAGLRDMQERTAERLGVWG